tara:strand:- start:7730 stop:8203 length:474 start_codon:yes stop_codon:yes gene_type:complete
MKMNYTLVKYIVPAIMIFFFARNIILVETDNMDSWMGGGMRMFGKIDKTLYRVAGFTAEYNGQDYFINLRSIKEFYREDRQVRIMPNDYRLTNTLNKIKRHKWCYNSDLGLLTSYENLNTCNILIDSLKIKRIQVFRVDYNPTNHIIRLNLINEQEN